MFSYPSFPLRLFSFTVFYFGSALSYSPVALSLSISPSLFICPCPLTTLDHARRSWPHIMLCNAMHSNDFHVITTTKVLVFRRSPIHSEQGKFQSLRMKRTRVVCTSRRALHDLLTKVNIDKMTAYRVVIMLPTLAILLRARTLGP